MNTKAKKIISISLNVLVWVFLAFAVLVTILTFASKNDKDGIPSIFGKSFVTIQSDSMKSDKPESFKKGDMLIVEKIAYGDQAKELEVGDIIVFRSKTDINRNGIVGDDINTHRIIEKKVNGTSVSFITQGDNREMCPNPDGEISYTDVLAVWEEGKLAGVGGVADFLRSSLGFFLVIVLPMALFFLYEVYSLVKIIWRKRLKRLKLKLFHPNKKKKSNAWLFKNTWHNKNNKIRKIRNKKNNFQDFFTKILQNYNFFSLLHIKCEKNTVHITIVAPKN
jgi:signal peptidase